MQHGKTNDKKIDPERNLSDNGKREIRTLITFLFSNNLLNDISLIYHSDKLRSSQTAEIIADITNPIQNLQSTEGLKPLDDPNIWFEKSSLLINPTILVGHLPHLGKLANLLLNKDVDKEETVINFNMGSILCLDKTKDSDNWYVKFFIPAF